MTAAATAYSVDLQCFALREHPDYQPAAAAGGGGGGGGSSELFSWGGARGWMAELTAIAAQKRRGGHVELSEERQRRQDAVVASLKERLTPVSGSASASASGKGEGGGGGGGGLLQLGKRRATLLRAPLPAQAQAGGGRVTMGRRAITADDDAAAAAAVAAGVGGGGGSASSSLSPTSKPPAGKKSRSSSSSNATAAAASSSAAAAAAAGVVGISGGGDIAVSLSAERQYRQQLQRRVQQLESEVAQGRALVAKREQERDHYRNYNMKLLAHNTNLRIAVREAQPTVPGEYSTSHSRSDIQ